MRIKFKVKNNNKIKKSLKKKQLERKNFQKERKKKEKVPKTKAKLGKRKHRRWDQDKSYHNINQNLKKQKKYKDSRLSTMKMRNKMERKYRRSKTYVKNKLMGS